MTEIKKLELKHIAPYLPYNLKCKTNKHAVSYGVESVLIVNGASLDINNNLNIELLLENELVFSNEMKTCIPLLRPMSDLYKERNGEVGIVELAKIACKSDGITCGISHINKYNGTVFLNDLTEFSYNRGGNFFLFDGEAESKYLIDQLALFEYLFANHYDVFGLIEQGLAINKNDIE